MILGVAVAARLLQRRSFAGLIGPDGFAPRRLRRSASRRRRRSARLAAWCWLALAAPTQAQPVAAWAAWLPLGAAGAPGADRGRGDRLPRLPDAGAGRAVPLAARLVAAAGTALRAAALEPASLGARRLAGGAAATLIGLVLADVTVRTGGLSLAMGLHFANNAVAVLMLAAAAELSGLSLFAGRRRPGGPGARCAACILARPRHARSRPTPSGSASAAGGGDCIPGGPVLSRRTTAAEGAGPR